METIKELADLRSFIQKKIDETEKKISELESDLETLKRALKSIDELLVKESFKPAIEVASKKKVAAVEETVPSKLISKDGKPLADLNITDTEIVVTPLSELPLDLRAGPLNRFLINRVLLSMQKEDIEKARKGLILEDEILDYEINAKDNKIQRIVIKNYRTPQRLKRIISALRWTINEMVFPKK